MSEDSSARDWIAVRGLHDASEVFAAIESGALYGVPLSSVLHEAFGPYLVNREHVSEWRERRNPPTVEEWRAQRASEQERTAIEAWRAARKQEAEQKRTDRMRAADVLAFLGWEHCPENLAKLRTLDRELHPHRQRYDNARRIYDRSVVEAFRDRLAKEST